MKSKHLLALLFVVATAYFIAPLPANAALNVTVEERQEKGGKSTNYYLSNNIDFRVKVKYRITGKGFNKSEGTTEHQRTLEKKEKMVYICESDLHTKPVIVSTTIVK